MKPYGERNKLKYNFKDNHTKGCLNWWETDCGIPVKSRERQKSKKYIREQLEDIEYFYK